MLIAVPFVLLLIASVSDDAEKKDEELAELKKELADTLSALDDI